MRTITLQDLERQFGEFSYRATDLSPVMRIGGLMALSEVKARFQTGTGPDGRTWAPLRFPRPEGGTIPLRNHGILAASYTSESDSTSFRVGTNLEKARVHHYGATIYPVKRKALTIPLTKEAVRAGSARAQGGLVLMGRYLVKKDPPRAVKGQTQKIVRHWILVLSVTIPARPQVGVSDALFKRFSYILVNFLRSGRLGE